MFVPPLALCVVSLALLAGVGCSGPADWALGSDALAAGRGRGARGLVFLHEGRHGLDVSSGKQCGPHRTENRACLVAGRVGGLKHGLHIPAPGKPPANVLVTAMNAVGLSAPSLGEVSGELPSLRG